GVRLIGFDKGAGASCAFGTEELALRAKGCVIEGGYGRAPQHGTLFDVRTDGLLARFEDCELRLLDLELNHIRSGATVVFEDCRLTDLLGTAGQPDRLPPGVRFVNSPRAAFPHRDSAAP